MKLSRLLKTLLMEVPDRLRRERLSVMMARLQELGIEAALADLAPVESRPPSIELKVRLRRKPIILFSKYQVLQRFSSGGMSEGFKVRTEDGSVCFLKRVPVSGIPADALRRELGVYSKLQRASVVNLLEFHTFERDHQHLALVTEFADGGTLDEYVTSRGGLKPPEAKRIAQIVLAGLRELHSLDIVHRDLKPANVLRAGGRWKLADFGISKDLQRLVTQGKTFKGSGTPDFAPPEQGGWGAEAHSSADVCAFGKLLAFLLSTRTDSVKLGPESWARLVRDCTAPVRGERPSLEDVQRGLARL